MVGEVDHATPERQCLGGTRVVVAEAAMKPDSVAGKCWCGSCVAILSIKDNNMKGTGEE